MTRKGIGLTGGRRALRATLLACLGALALAAPAAGAQSGHLDSQFGRSGKITISTGLLGPAVESIWPGESKGFRPQLVAAGKGSILFADRQRIFRVEKSGRLDPQFGQGGYVTVEAPNGHLLTPHDIAIDPAGRILVAADVQDAGAQPEKTPGLDEHGFPLHGPPLSRAAVLRLLPNGAPDPSFGSGGIVESTVNAPAPSYEGRSYATPSVRGLAVASDPQGRPILSGSFVSQAFACYPFTFMQFATKAFVARFGAGGALESVSADPAVAAPGAGTALLRAGSGNSIFERYANGICQRGGPLDEDSTIAFLDSDGNPSGGFAPATVSFAGPPALAGDARGRVVLAGQKELSNEGLGYVATRLRADGSLDTGFGQGGEASLDASTGPLDQIAVDASNGLLVPGSLRGTSEAGGGLAVSRLTARGQLDGRFGSQGTLQIRFNAAESGSAAATMVDGAGRIVIAGSLVPTGHGPV